MKNFFKMFMFLGLMFVLVGCNSEPTNLTTETTEDQLFVKLNQVYEMAVEADAFDGTYEEWLESVEGPQGEPGREVVLQVYEGYIQWQYSGEDSWHNLIEIVSLIGPKGEQGDNVLFNVSDTHIQYKYQNDSEWNDLLSLDLLTGEQGEQGEQGKEVILQVSEGYIQWQYSGENTWINLLELESLTAPKISFNVNDTHIQYKYENDVEWTNLIALDLLVGEQGERGSQVDLQVSDGYIQWKYQDVDTWNQLLDLSILIGENGEDGLTPYIGDNNNWWIGDTDTGVSPTGQENMDRVGTNGLYFDLTIVNGIAGYEVTAYTGTESNIVIPNRVFGEKVISIKQGALPKTVTSISISKYTEKLPIFEDYEYLVEFDFNSAPVSYLSDDAFRDAMSLKTIRNYESLTHLGSYSFYNTKILFTGIDFDNITHIGHYAFYANSYSNIDISGLIFEEINDEVIISDQTFIYLPETVVSIGERAFPLEFQYIMAEIQV
ncbi:MAG: leucine-rich repeat domain-containing protein [Candidatus Izemoplasmatales bacterium]